MHWSLTYKHFDPWLMRPLMAGVISQAEASQVWDEWLMAGQPDAFSPDDPALQKVAMRLHLWALPVEGMVQ